MLNITIIQLSSSLKIQKIIYNTKNKRRNSTKKNKMKSTNMAFLYDIKKKKMDVEVGREELLHHITITKKLLVLSLVCFNTKISLHCILKT